MADFSQYENKSGFTFGDKVAILGDSNGDGVLLGIKGDTAKVAFPQKEGEDGFVDGTVRFVDVGALMWA